MAIPRLARLQKRILQWLAADHHRTKGVIRSSHEELVKAVGGYKGNVTCIPHIIVRVGVAVFVKTYHWATLTL